MSRRAKGPRLWLRPARRDESGAITHGSVWFILDGTKQRSTGIGASDIERASKALAEYIEVAHATKAQRSNSRDPSQIPVADVVGMYAQLVGEKHARPDETKARLKAILAFFGEMMLSEVNGDSCRDYVKQRTTFAAARRELEDFRAAINYHRAEGKHDKIVSVVLPEKSLPRERWLTRAEAAHLILTTWRYRETKTEYGFRGINTIRQGSRTYYYAWRDGPRVHAKFGTPAFAAEYAELIKERPWSKYPRRHVARFMVVARYMGSRASVICSASIEPRRPKGRAWVNLTTGMFYGRPSDERETNKKKQTVRVPPALLAHMRRWRARGQRYVVQWLGKPVLRIDKAHAAAVFDAGLDTDVTPHTWRHSLATWLVQAGTNPADVADYLGMTVETLLRTYRHEMPDNSAVVHAAMRRKPAPEMVR